MVVIHIKNSDSDTFLYETTTSTKNDDLIRDLVSVWNLRIRLIQLVGGIRELAKYGPMKPPDKAGLDELNEKFDGGCNISKGENYLADPTGIRTGDGPGAHMAETIEKVACDTESVLDKNNVIRKIPISLAVLQEKLDMIRGVVTMAYPMGLPEFDTIRLTIAGNEGLEGTAASQELMDPDTAELWAASKIFDRGNTVADRLGRNEKTKTIAKLQKLGGGPPGREAAVSEEEKKAMMAYYFKKQEEMKKMSESSEDDYLHSSWADPKQLQKSLRGQSDIKAPGLR